ncbi:hypothetical protein B4113_3586 [Geobacillus sp. B4113_201601]|nr:hypothetical protein B4113_3586 [Geobacillus sp. B4113_201601]
MCRNITQKGDVSAPIKRQHGDVRLPPPFVALLPSGEFQPYHPDENQ